MGLRKSLNNKKTESVTSIKQIKTKRKTKIIPSSMYQQNTRRSFDNSVQRTRNNENEKPELIMYQAVPISIFNR
jgi:hypothetical protein